MLGMQAQDFGRDWTRAADEIFDTEIMRDLALEILESTLEEDDLHHAVEFYASELGQRLVAVENAGHMTRDDDPDGTMGQKLVAQMVETGAPRLAILKRMNTAVDSEGHGLHAYQEVQMRFLLSAAAAGVIDLKLDEQGLRNALRQQQDEMRMAIQMAGLASTAYTYRDFSDADLEQYTLALETPRMQRVYALLNAVQYEIMANRYERLAVRMADMHPGQEL